MADACVHPSLAGARQSPRTLRVSGLRAGLPIMFLTDERVAAASSTRVRVLGYQQIRAAHRDGAVMTRLVATIVLVFAAPSILGAQQPASIPTSLGLTRSLWDSGADAVATVDGGQVVSPPAGPAPTPRHTGVKALVKDLVEDLKHLPSKNSGGRDRTPGRRGGGVCPPLAMTARRSKERILRCA
jgi:hypothetical protein